MLAVSKMEHARKIGEVLHRKLWRIRNWPDKGAAVALAGPGYARHTKSALGVREAAKYPNERAEEYIAVLHPVARL